MLKQHRRGRHKDSNGLQLGEVAIQTTLTEHLGDVAIRQNTHKVAEANVATFCIVAEASVAAFCIAVEANKVVEAIVATFCIAAEANVASEVATKTKTCNNWAKSACAFNR